MPTLAQINHKARALLRQNLDPVEFALYVQQFERVMPNTAAKRPSRASISFDEIRARIAALRTEGRPRETGPPAQASG
jgi:hypothetical protein